MPRTEEGPADVSTRERAAATLSAQQSFGGRLRTLRKWCRASQVSFAKVSGISPKALRRYEKGSALPPPEHLATLGEVLNASVVFLVHGAGPPSHEDLTVLRLAWTMVLASPGHVRATLQLVEGILSQMPDPGGLVN